MEKINSELAGEIESLKIKLNEALETLDAIRSGDVDALVVSGPNGDKVYTIKTIDQSYRTIVETMNEGAATLTADGTILYCNKRLAEMLMVPLERILGNSIQNFIPPKETKNFNSLFRQGFKNKSRGELSLRTEKGTHATVFFSSRLIQTEEIKSLCAIFTDLTEQKRAKEMSEKAKGLQDIGTLAATVAHELRNPLAAIKMAAFNIKRKKGNLPIDKHIYHINKKISESDQIINNLLFYTRLQTPRYEKINICALLKESIEAAKNRYSSYMVSVKKEIGPCKGIIIDADSLQIRELFDNILSNSFDAVSDGKGEIKVGLNYNRKDRNFIKINFSDNGTGIDKKFLKNIFEPFFTTKAKGTGLGLAVCNQVVNLHNGKIKISSSKLKGTEVEILLPVKNR